MLVDAKCSRITQRHPRDPLSPKFQSQNAWRCVHPCPARWWEHEHEEDHTGFSIYLSLRIEPKRKCCMIGNLARHSALYIFNKPELIFSQLNTPLMSLSIGEVSLRFPFFTCAMLTPHCYFFAPCVRIPEESVWYLLYKHHTWKIQVFCSKLVENVVSMNGVRFDMIVLNKLRSTPKEKTCCHT